jgi:hypothetical protein
VQHCDGKSSRLVVASIFSDRVAPISFVSPLGNAQLDAHRDVSDFGQYCYRSVEGYDKRRVLLTH